MHSHTLTSFFTFSFLFVPLLFSQSSTWKPLSHFQLLPSLCSLHVISLCVLSALILNSHICSSFHSHCHPLTSDSFSFTWSWKLNLSFCLPFFHQSQPSHPALVRAVALSDAFRTNNPWINYWPVSSCLISHNAYSWSYVLQNFVVPY